MYYLYTKKLYNMLLTHHKGFVTHMIYYKIIINYHYYTTSDYILSDLYFMSFSVCQHQCPVETLTIDYCISRSADAVKSIHSS